MIKQFTLSLPFIYLLFESGAKIIEEDNAFLSSSEGISASFVDKPNYRLYRGKNVAYFTYAQALGHYLHYSEEKSHFVYLRDDVLRSIKIETNALEYSEILGEDEINQIVDYLDYHNLIGKGEIRKLKVIISLKSDFIQRWFVAKLNNNVQGVMLFLPNSDEIMALAYHFTMNNAIFKYLLFYGLKKMEHPYINMGTHQIPHLAYQEFPVFFGVYDDKEMAVIYYKMKPRDLMIKDLLISGLYAQIKSNEKENSLLLHLGEMNYLSEHNHVDLDLPNRIQIHENGGKAFLLGIKVIHAMDDCLEEVDFKTFFTFVKKVKEYQTEDYQKDLAKVWGLGGHFYLYKVHDKIVGGGVIEFASLNYTYTSYVFTLAKYRHQGYGKKLVQALSVLDNTCKQNLLIVLDENLIPFYQSCGYEVLHRIDYC